eukprot:gene18696-7753_t
MRGPVGVLPLFSACSAAAQHAVPLQVPPKVGRGACAAPTHNRTAFNQDDLKHIFTPSWQECCSACASLSGCKAYTWNGGGLDNCDLKSAPNQPRPDPNSVSSIVGPHPPAPPTPSPTITPPPQPKPSPPTPSPPLPPVPPVERTWMNRSEPAGVRAHKLLGFMSLSEKVLMLHGQHSEDKEYGWYVGRVSGNPRLGIPTLQMNDGPQGFRDMNGSHAGSTTAYPSGLTVAASWDPEVAGVWGQSMGEEFSGKGSNVQLGPGLCIARIPQNGRNFEYMSGEDPFLGYTLVQPAIKGIQSKGVIANAKHWVANSQETHRTTDTSAGVGSVMCSYNKIQASPGSPSLWSCENPETLRRDLRERLGFNGWVMSDWGATHSPSINAGLDQEMPAGGSMNKAPSDPGNCDHLCALIANGTVTQQTVDASALRILTQMFAVGLFDGDVTSNATTARNVTSPAHTRAARRVASAGI